MTNNPWHNAVLTQIDPRTLLLDHNSRTIIDLETEDPDLVASVRKHGVKLPVLATPADDGLRVLDGHSRTIAAILAVDEHPTIPVLVTDVTGEQDWELLRDQWIANEVRRGYCAADKARIMEELTLFGLSAQDIAEQLSTTTQIVEAGLAVRRSTTATDATREHPELDVLQLAALAEFEDNPNASQELATTLAQEPDQFDHVVSRLRHRRAAYEARDAQVAELRAAGVTVLDTVDANTTLPLRSLLRSKQDRTSLGATPENHADCPGHAVDVSVSYSQVHVTYVCQNWKSHGHVDAWSTAIRAPLSEAEKTERRRVRANNEAWRAAQDVRRCWLRTNLFAAGKPPRRAQQYLLSALATGGPHLTRALTRGSHYACELLGLREPRLGRPHPIIGRARRSTADQALMMTIAVLVGAFEEALEGNTGLNTWRRPSPEDRLYFAALKDWGYVLSTVERLVLDSCADADQSADEIAA